MTSDVLRYAISLFRMRRPVDIHVGKRLQAFRVREGLSSANVAALLSVPRSHIERFEAGHMRLSASRLFILANYLNVPVAAFFDRREGTL